MPMPQCNADMSGTLIMPCSHPCGDNDYILLATLPKVGPFGAPYSEYEANYFSEAEQEIPYGSGLNARRPTAGARTHQRWAAGWVAYPAGALLDTALLHLPFPSPRAWVGQLGPSPSFDNDLDQRLRNSLTLVFRRLAKIRMIWRLRRTVLYLICTS